MCACGPMCADACLRGPVGGYVYPYCCVLMRPPAVARIRAKSSAIRTSVASTDVRPKKTKTSSPHKSSSSSDANRTQPVTSQCISLTHVLCASASWHCLLAASFARTLGERSTQKCLCKLETEMFVLAGDTALLTARGRCECAHRSARQS
jgi:hypothetical protein